ncbi:MAG: hypothetical protein Q9218_006498 [Villophora microphyllina]
MATRGYMGRGKDGFDSLLVKSEGGEAEEIVSEENGMLISMILRQYFMSLKVLGRWRRWGSNLGRHWEGIHDVFHSQGNMDVVEPKQVGRKRTKNGDVKGGDGEEHVHEDSDEDIDHSSISHDAVEKGEEEKRKAYLARSVSRHWMRVAGIATHSVGTVDHQSATGEEEYHPDWTRGIAPKVEGRIVIEGGDAEPMKHGE